MLKITKEYIQKVTDKTNEIMKRRGYVITVNKYNVEIILEAIEELGNDT